MNGNSGSQIQQARLLPILPEAVYTARRKLQKHRKELFYNRESERPVWAQPVVTERKHEVKLPSEEPVVESIQRKPQSSCVVVDRRNRKMLQHAVWKQKFEFLYGQVMGEEALNAGSEAPTLAAGPAEHEKKRRPSALMIKSGGEGDEKCRAGSRPSSRQGSPSSSRPGSRLSHSRPGSRLSHSKPGCRLQLREHAEEDFPFPSASLVPSASVPSVRLAFATWTQPKLRRVSGQPSIPAILRSDSSVKLLTQDLVQVRDDYYGGDELLMHEDILHSANPELFPLRRGTGKAFPLEAMSMPQNDGFY